MEDTKLNPDEVTELVWQARLGNDAARSKLILQNINAPYYMSYKKCPSWLQQEEALSAASYWLVIAVDRYIQQEINIPLSTVIFNTMKWGLSYERTQGDMCGQHEEYSEATEGFEDGIIPKNMLTPDLCCFDDTEEDMIRQERILSVHLVLNSMPEERSSLLRRYYGIGCKKQTLKQIAETDGVSRNKVQLLHTKYQRAFRREWLKRNQYSM